MFAGHGAARVEIVKLSIVIICWNDARDIVKCLESVYAETKSLDFEVIVTDNGSTDGSVALVRRHFPKARVVENAQNIGFGAGNNRGFRAATGEHVLILNPDTIIHDRALEKMVAYAELHPEAGAVGCRALNTDGSVQATAHPRPTVRGYLIWALYLRPFGRLSKAFLADEYPGWTGQAEQEVGFAAACCLLVRGSLLKTLGGFDERFFHQFEDADLCHRVWNAGQRVVFFPGAVITHIGGQNRGRYPVKVILETQRSKYRYFHKHYGNRGAIQIRRVSLIHLGLRFAGYRLLSLFRRGEAMSNRLNMYRVLLKWHRGVDPVRFAETGAEPNVGFEPLAPAAGAAKNGLTNNLKCAPPLVS
jgi:N-acetylglucosaminyl-diphospho-decaprenol L-rhamnosyltransferase